VEYSDFQCPFCKDWNDETEKLIEDTYIATGKVYFTYIPYGPTGQYIGPESKDAAMAAFCAGDQGKFWEYHDMLFANQTGENVGDYTAKRLEAFADNLGLNMSQFRSCFNANKFADALNQGIQQGTQAQIGGTPSFLINGSLIEGALPFSEFQQKIEAALAAADANK
jgi:protein-disulfide isomerase